MELSPDGVAFIQGEEGLSLTAHADADGHSIGFGHFISGYEAAGIGRNLGPDSTITRDEAIALFMRDVKSAEVTVNPNVTAPLTQGNSMRWWILSITKGAGG